MSESKQISKKILLCLIQSCLHQFLFSLTAEYNHKNTGYFHFTSYCDFRTEMIQGPRIAQSVVCWTRCPVWCSIVGSILRWASGRGDFSLGVNMGSDSISQKLLDESINRDLVCAHMHFIMWTQKDPDIHVLNGWMLVTKTQPACTSHENGLWLPLWLN